MFFRYLKRRYSFIRKAQYFILSHLLNISLAILAYLPIKLVLKLVVPLLTFFAGRTYISKAMYSSIKKAFPEKSHDDIKNIIKKSWNNITKMALELTNSKRSFYTQKKVVSEVEQQTEELLRKRSQIDSSERAPLIFTTAHLSSGQAAILPLLEHIPDETIGFVYKEITLNKHLMSYFQNTVTYFFKDRSIAPISNQRPYQAASSLLKDGMPVIVLSDKKVRSSGIPVKFFGKTIRMSPLAALLAVGRNSPIIPWWFFSLEDGSYKVTFGKPLYPDKKLSRQENLLYLTQQIATYMEDQIRKSPETWMWMIKDVIGIFH